MRARRERVFIIMRARHERVNNVIATMATTGVADEINPFSAKSIFGGKKKKVFRKFYSYFSFMLERKILNTGSFFFFFGGGGQLTELFHRTMKKKKKIENPAKCELSLTKPLTLTLFW